MSDTPRWVKVFGLVTLVVAALVVVVLATGGGGHGPGRHSGDVPRGHTVSPSGVAHPQP